MTVTAIVGANWGDEGKGKTTDYLAAEADYVVRFQGGANAGHTVTVGGDKFILHLVPSGILHPEKVCVIANGVVVDPEELLRQEKEAQEKSASPGEGASEEAQEGESENAESTEGESNG